MKDVKKIAESLHPLERQVLPFLSKNNNYHDLVNNSKMPEVAVMRALQWLENKKAVTLKEDVSKKVVLDKNGKIYAVQGLPEIQVLKKLQSEKNDQGTLLTDLTKTLKLSQQEIQISIGFLKKENLIELNKLGQDKIYVKLTTEGKHKQNFPDQEILEQIAKNQTPKNIPNELWKRKNVLEEKLVKDRVIELTSLGKELTKIKVGDNIIEKLTSSLLKTGEWKTKKLRHYDVSVNVPKIYPGKKQHYRKFLDSVRQKFVAMGFSEMNGPIVESDFWDMDALFMPQFHSARDIHEAYYIKEPSQINIDKDILKNVKLAHEKGFNTGSKGWQYKFDIERTKRTLLRTQGTACSARMLTSKNLQIPGKYFAIAKCFRYDVIDATHLPDFYQTEGIVINEGLNFKNLKGLLKMFAEEFAQTDQIKIKPAYFPFTEPSAELFAKHPEMGWIELGGSGIFRPEVTKPLGIDVPVIAWGLGIDRIGMFNMKIDDIRELYSQDLSFLRNQKVI